MEHAMKIIVLFTLIVAAWFVPVVLHAQDGNAKSEAITILDAKLGTDVKDKEIVGQDSVFSLNSKVWVLVKVEGAANETLTATWKSANVSKESKLPVGGSPWRTWSAKTANKAGAWTVAIADSKGNTLKELQFTVK
jgi:hypothetical protein